MKINPKRKPDYNRMVEMLDYNPDTGIFIWVKSPGRGHSVGVVAGCVSKSTGYRYICIDGVTYFAHRLAFYYIHQYWPENEIDHINRNRSDNRIVNLREVSLFCQAQNATQRCDNMSGVKGVSKHTRYNKWVVQIRNGKEYSYLGWYEDFDEAVCARLAAEQCLNRNVCEVDSPAFQYVQQMF